MSYFRRLMMAQQQMEDPYDFNGVDKYLDTGIKLWTGGDFTLLMAFTSRAVDAGANQTIFTTRDYGSTHGAALSHVTGTNFARCNIIGRSVGANQFSSSIIDIKRGYFLNREGSKLYYRAITASSDTGRTSSTGVTFPSATTDETVLLGANRLQGGLGEFWDGKIHAIEYFARSLTTTERTNWFKAQGL